MTLPQICKGRHSSPIALASAAHTLLFLLHKYPDRALSSFSQGMLVTTYTMLYGCLAVVWCSSKPAILKLLAILLRYPLSCCTSVLVAVIARHTSRCRMCRCWSMPTIWFRLVHASTVYVHAEGGVLSVAAVVKDNRVTLRGRACAAGCLKLYMARTPQVCLVRHLPTLA